MERESYELIDNDAKKQYEFRIGDQLARIKYVRTKDDEIELTSTEVPANLAGKGIASQLIEKVLQQIELQELRLIPLCPFVIGYIQKYPDWRRIVKKGIDI